MTARLTADADDDHRPLSAGAVGAAAAAAPGAVRGRLPHPGRDRVLRRQLGLTDAEVTAVATFYSMYRRTPTGEYLVGVCTNTLCAIMGGDAILDALQDHLGVHAGQTTDDGTRHPRTHRVQRRLRLRPVVMVNWEFFDNQTPSSARDLVDGLRAGEPPMPTPRRAAVHLQGDRASPRGPARPEPPTPGPPVTRPWPDCGSPSEQGMAAPARRTPVRHAATGRPTAQGRGRRGDQGRTRTGTVGHRARRAGTTETDPDATDSGLK